MFIIIKIYNEGEENVWTEGETGTPNSRKKTWIAPVHATFAELDYHIPPGDHLPL